MSSDIFPLNLESDFPPKPHGRDHLRRDNGLRPSSGHRLNTSSANSSLPLLLAPDLNIAFLVTIFARTSDRKVVGRCYSTFVAIPSLCDFFLASSPPLCRRRRQTSFDVVDDFRMLPCYARARYVTIIAIIIIILFFAIISSS